MAGFSSKVIKDLEVIKENNLLDSCVTVGF
jgi:hypothetical protein